MKLDIRKFVSAVAMLVTFIVAFPNHGSEIRAQSKLPPALEPYVPTKIEWVVLDMAAHDRVDLSSQTGYSVDFVSSHADTVVIVVRYLPTVDRRIMNMAVDTKRKIARMEIETYGLQNSVKVREDIEMAKP